MSWDVNICPRSSDLVLGFLIDPLVFWAKKKHLVCIKGKQLNFALLGYSAAQKTFNLKSEDLSFSSISCYLSNFEWVT